MGAQMQKIAAFLINGAYRLCDWVVSLVTGVHNAIDQSMTLHHSAWAWGVLAVAILAVVVFVLQFVWKPVPKPDKPRKMEVKPKPYRLLLLCAVVGIVYLAACFAAMD
ncbi:MAG: hypothetical protein LUF68_06690 [Clostridiales bacterium]|nr:hypothetical protein [Clostridiales bacterium]